MSIKDELIDIDQTYKIYLEKKKEFYKSLKEYNKLLKLWDESEEEEEEEEERRKKNEK